MNTKSTPVNPNATKEARDTLMFLAEHAGKSIITGQHTQTNDLREIKEIEKIIRDNFKLTPKAIIETLDLRRPIYKKCAAYGHFGRLDLDLPWEKLDKVEDIKKYLNK